MQTQEDRFTGHFHTIMIDLQVKYGFSEASVLQIRTIYDQYLHNYPFTKPETVIAAAIVQIGQITAPLVQRSFLYCDLNISPQTISACLRRMRALMHLPPYSRPRKKPTPASSTSVKTS